MGKFLKNKQMHFSREKKKWQYLQSKPTTSGINPYLFAGQNVTDLNGTEEDASFLVCRIDLSGMACTTLGSCS